jgi:hypothetical protein
MVTTLRAFLVFVLQPISQLENLAKVRMTNEILELHVSHVVGLTVVLLTVRVGCSVGKRFSAFMVQR